MTANILFTLAIASLGGLGMLFIPYVFSGVVGYFHDRRLHLLQLTTASIMWATAAAIVIGSVATIVGRLTGTPNGLVDLLGWGIVSSVAFLFLGDALVMHEHTRPRVQLLGSIMGGAALSGWIYSTAKLIAQAFV